MAVNKFGADIESTANGGLDPIMQTKFIYSIGTQGDKVKLSDTIDDIEGNISSLLNAVGTLTDKVENLESAVPEESGVATVIEGNTPIGAALRKNKSALLLIGNTATAYIPKTKDSSVPVLGTVYEFDPYGNGDIQNQIGIKNNSHSGSGRQFDTLLMGNTEDKVNFNSLAQVSEVTSSFKILSCVIGSSNLTNDDFAQDGLELSGYRIHIWGMHGNDSSLHHLMIAKDVMTDDVIITNLGTVSLTGAASLVVE